MNVFNEKVIGPLEHQDEHDTARLFFCVRECENFPPSFDPMAVTKELTY